MPVYGPLRIVRWPRAMGAASSQDQISEYWQKLARMAPAEVTGFYLTFRAIAVGDLTKEQIASDHIAANWPWVGVVLVVLVKALATRRTASIFSAQRGAVAISSIAFVFWVLTMDHYISFVSAFADRRVSALGAALFTFVVPYFYKGDPPPRPEPG